MFKKRDKNITLSDEDILHSLNYNIILRNREYQLTKENILYSDYRIFNHQSEIKGYYSKKDNILELYITKLDKFKQLMNNIALYLEIPIQEILYKYEKECVYCNIYRVIEKYDITKKFDFIVFFRNYEWITHIRKMKNNLLKIEFPYRETLCYSYNILEEKYFVITASRNENEFIILDPISSKIRLGIKYPQDN